MDRLFDDSDNEEDFNWKTNNEYAKRYDNWREKEEVHKLEAKYGENLNLNQLNEESSDDEEDEESDENLEVSEKFEKDFLKTLSLLKKKDPRIYDKEFKCFEDAAEKVEFSGKVKKKVEKEKPLHIRDYQRNIILEKGGKLSDDEDNNESFNDMPQRPQSPSHVEEEKRIKESFAKVLNEDVDEENENKDETIAGLFKKRERTEEELEAEEKTYREWLTGQAEHLDDAKEEKELEPLKEFWSDPKLNERESFLRDYILKQRYLERNDTKYIPSYDEIVHDSDNDLEEDENTIKEQVSFERAYNFRFEEPDQDFIKRYPRTMEQSMRPKDDKRARKRAELKDRKANEKKKKMEEIARLKAFKLKEIQEKIAKLKEITGNQDLAFHDQDIEGDFDPAEHDKRMQALFDEEFYDGNDTEKPVFPDLDDELELENWDNYEEEVGKKGRSSAKINTDLHCEDPDFNMDADYDAKKSKTSLLDEITETLGKKRRNRKRKNKLSEVLAADKPKFDPYTADKTYSQYLEEYYKLDCEDVIGDLPCRFKYRDVVPNNYGLSIEEILMADDKELNQWVPLKKTLKLRPEHKEKGDVMTYQIRANNIALKKKLLPSLFKEPEEEPDYPVIARPEENNDAEVTEKKKKKKKKKKKPKQNRINPTDEENIVNENEIIEENDGNSQTDEVRLKANSQTESKSSKKRKRKQKDNDYTITPSVEPNSVQDKNDSAEAKVDSAEINQPKVSSFIRKEKKKELQETVDKSEHFNNGQKPSIVSKKNKRKLEPNQNSETTATPSKKVKLDKNKKQNIQNKNKQFNKKASKPHKGKAGNEKTDNDPINKLSDERLKAYGLNPKKYRSFLKYKKF